MSSKLDELDDICEVVNMMECFSLDTNGLRTMEDMKNKLRKHLEQSPLRKTGHTFQVLSEARQTDVNKREKLRQFYLDTRSVLGELDENFIRTLQKGLGDFRSTLEEHIRSLKREQYVVLVAGETSAGKSSIINLILGEELLPSSVLPTTSTICEMKYGDKPMVQIHYKDSESQDSRLLIWELDDPEKSYKDQIQSLVAIEKARDERSPYKKIELFWPHPLFKEGVMIVDSPGVGESDVMDEFVFGYLPDAFAFIYVINSVNAGGIQQDRLGKLLTHVSKLKTEVQMDAALFTSCALFVCNKWDQIPPSEAENVKKTQIELLKKKLGNLDPVSQIVHLSCEKAQLAQSFDLITEDFGALLAGISNLIVVSMQKNLEIYCRWIDDLLSRVFRQVSVLLETAKMSRLETEKRMADVMTRMEELQSTQKRNFTELSEYQSKIIEEIIGKLATHFSAEVTSGRFCSWSPDEVPAAKSTWEETKNEVLKSVSSRTQQFIQDWEDEENEFAKAQVALIKYCYERYNVMEEEIRNVEGDILFNGAAKEVLYPMHITPTIPRAKIKGKSIGVIAPVWLRQGLASVVVNHPFLGSLRAKVKKKFQDKHKLEKYRENPCGYLAKRSKKCLKCITSHERLLPFINEQLQDAVLFLKQIKTRIPQLREGDEEFYQQLLADTRSKSAIQGLYGPLDKRLESILLKLSFYSISEVRQSDFTEKDLQWKDEDDSIVGRGSFSVVYSGVLAREGHVEVALKVHNDLLTCDNVRFCFEEERALRELNHPNIVEFFGTHLQRTPEGTRVIFVLKLCECSLRNYILSHPEVAPAQTLDPAHRKTVYIWCQQILGALRYIHDKGFVHRDLNLDNVLLTRNNMIKVTAVGVASRICGSSLYLAPEVLESRVYSSKTDMYSFGFVLWELWYGTTLSADSVTDGSRPTHLQGTHQSQLWQDMMERCWCSEPRDRLTAVDCWRCFRTILKEDEITKSGCSRPVPQTRTSERRHPSGHTSKHSRPKRVPKPIPRSIKPKQKSVFYTPTSEDSAV